MRYLTALTGAALLIPAGAYADWQYSSWGMTPDALEAAAKSAGVVISREDKQAYSTKARVLFSADYVAIPYRFRAYYGFIDGKLSEVDLDLVGGGDSCWELQRNLRDQYGQPTESWNSATNVTIEWRDGPRANLVRNSLLKAVPPTCRLHYRQIPAAGGL